MQGWRISMEDAKITELEIDENRACFGVFDGHGGKEVAMFVAKNFIPELLHNTHYQTGRMDTALSQTFLRMDVLLQTDAGKQQLVKFMRDLPEGAVVSPGECDSMAGCTSVVGLLHGTDLYVANAGDSRCVLAKKGKAIEMTIDHKPDLTSEKERITRAGGVVEEGRVMGNLNLSRSIGDLEYKRNPELPPEDQMITAYPEVKKEKIDRDTDFMVLACDGVWDILTSQECVDFIYQRLQTSTLSDIVESLLDRCLAKDVASSGGLGCDNMTCIIVDLRSY